MRGAPVRQNFSRFALVCFGSIGAAAACGQHRYPVGEATQDAGSNPLGVAGAAGGQAGSDIGGAAGAGGATDAGSDAGAAGGATATVQCPIVGAALPTRPIAIADALLADRLATFLWGARADDSLVGRVAALSPRTNASVAALAREMLSDGRASAGVEALGTDWLKLGDAASATDALGVSLAEESREFLLHLLLGAGDGKLQTLLTANYSFVDSQLAPLYGVAVPTQPGFVKTDLDATQRSGILTQPGFLSRKPHVSTRGTWVRTALLCSFDIVPPPGESTPVKNIPAGWSYRQALDATVASPTCAVCHSLIDPIGYAFEHYNPVGRWRDTDNGVAVDARGAARALTVGPDLLFDGAIELGRQLAQSCTVHLCVAQRFLEQALGGPLRTSELASRDELARAFVASGLDLRELLVLTTAVEAFVGP